MIALTFGLETPSGVALVEPNDIIAIHWTEGAKIAKSTNIDRISGLGWCREEICEEEELRKFIQRFSWLFVDY